MSGNKWQEIGADFMAENRITNFGDPSWKKTYSIPGENTQNSEPEYELEYEFEEPEYETESKEEAEYEREYAGRNVKEETEYSSRYDFGHYEMENDYKPAESYAEEPEYHYEYVFE